MRTARNFMSAVDIDSSHGKRKKGGARVSTLCLLAGLLATLALGGCASSTRINADDNPVFLPAIRMGINFGEGKQAASEPQTGHAIDFGVAKSKGNDSQSLVAGQSPIILNNTTFTAPQQLRNDFDFRFADISWRWRKFFAERSLGLEVTAGVGYSSLDLSVSSPTQRASDHLFTRGPQAGIGFIWRLNPGNSIKVRGSKFISGDIYGSRYELSYATALAENLTLRAGYEGWEVEGHYMSDLSSDFRLRFSGPTLALDWNFNARN